MATIPEKVKEFMTGKVGWVATASGSGVPNVTPKGSVRIVDDSHILFADLFSLKTRANMKENPKVAVTVIDEKSGEGYQLKGKAEMLESGEVFNKMKAELAKAPVDLPEPKYAVLIAVESIFNQSAGPDAGKEL